MRDLPAERAALAKAGIFTELQNGFAGPAAIGHLGVPMNLRTVVLAVVAVLFLIAPRSLHADTIYSYTSPAYDECTGTYCSGGPYALSFTFDVASGTPLDNLTLFGAGSNVTADVSSFSFTDGSGLEIGGANATAYSFQIGTDSAGDMTAWSVWADAGGSTQPVFEAVGSNSYTTATYVDYSMVGTEANPAENLGNWAPVPEPSSLLLLCVGLAGLAMMALRKDTLCKG